LTMTVRQREEHRGKPMVKWLAATNGDHFRCKEVQLTR
jgi:hypothetical protein